MLPHMQQARALLAQKQAEIFDIEAQMAALARTLAAARDAQQLIWEGLQSYKYPVLSLPNEVVCEIFVHTIPPYPEPPLPFSDCSPTVLTRICRQWRELAVETPRLWRTISLLNPRKSLEPQQAFRIASLWLKRSGSCPLSIRADDLNPVLSVLLPERMRWEHLKLHVDDPTDMQEGPFPLLRSLDLILMPKNAATPFLLPSQSAPLLRSVRIFAQNGGTIDLPWAQLTSLMLYLQRTPGFRRILRQTRHLVHCTLYCPFSDTDGLGSEIHLPHLEFLTFTGGAIKDFLGSLLAPNLQALHVPEPSLGSQPIDTLKSFISKSNCKLKEMQIVSEAAISSEDAYRAAFPSVPRVTVSDRRCVSSDSESDSD
ncbi:F-box domain-containing protein [Favolaschia claudopus]|uniref:F-box domain-containing protein n=1 Tax=Favolaschia claudopus TaxID=2862362 RepID=A0AAW0DCP1_9AGAR